MKATASLVLLALTALLASCTPPRASGPKPADRSPTADAPRAGAEQVVGLHLLSYTSDSLLVELGKVVPTLAAQGVNLIFLEVDYAFDFQSHPELRRGRHITRDGARQFAAVCRRHGIRLVPQFQSVGHQSWKEHTGPLLTVYPELDLTPGAFPGNEGIYCREWDVANPRVNEIVFALIDEIVEAFEADGIHAGMDEIFLLGSEHSPSTRGQDPAALFARVVNEFHDHFVKEKGLELFIWGDRLIDAEAHGYGSWDASNYGTAPAVDLIPRDIVICDWHYRPRATYTSVPMFAKRGFRVLPCSWNDLDGVQALVRYSYRLQHRNVIGHLFTTWSWVGPAELTAYPPMVTGIETLRSGRYHEVGFELVSASPDGVLEVALSATDPELAIHYTADGSAPGWQSQAYITPVRLDRSAAIRAIAFRGERQVADEASQAFTVHQATGRPVSLAPPPSPKYPTAGGVGALVNGAFGSRSYSDGQWVGVESEDLVATIDLGAPVPVSSVTIRTLRNLRSWVMPAGRVDVLGSEDGASFVELGTAAGTGVAEDAIVTSRVTFAPTAVRHLRTRVHHQALPEGHEGAGQAAWIFVDEIVVE